MSEAELLNQLKTASSDLLWMSESDYPFEVFLWEIDTLTSGQLLQQTNHDPDSPLQTIEIDSFFGRVVQEQSWHDPTQVATVKRYQTLVKLLKEHLSNLQVFRVGEIEIDIYIIGKTSVGHWAGLSTKAVAT